MASIFGTKKNKANDTAPEKSAPKADRADMKKDTVDLDKPTDEAKIDSILRLKSVLLRPHITEKATDSQTKGNVYTFVVLKDANKKEVVQAVKSIYGVDAKRVRIVNIRAKKVRTRKGGAGVKSGYKKAYVHLESGDSIEFV